MLPKNFDGYFKIACNPEMGCGWWIAFVNPSGCLIGHAYFYKSSWHTGMSDLLSYEESYFRTKQDALKAFFEQYPDAEIVDESEKLHVILRKGQ